MESSYKQSSPTASLLTMGNPDHTQTPSYSGGSDFGNANSPTMGMMLQTASNNNVARFTTSTLPDYRSNLPAHNYNGAYDNAILPSPMNGATNSHPNSAPGLPDGQSPTINHHHRLSISSNGPFGVQDGHTSLGGGSDTASQRGQGSFSGDVFGDSGTGNNSNETLDSQQQGDEHGKNADGPLAPAWSELKTKAGKERKRLPLACIACRRKKIRCSGEKPACKHCLRSRIPCVYKVTTRKAAPRTDYMAMLDKRLKRMEDRVIKIIPKEEQGVVAATGRSNVKPPLPPAPPKSAGGSKKRGAEQAFTGELDDWASTKSGTADAKRQTQPETEKEPLKPIEADEHSLLREGADSLPPKDIQEHLSEVFFDYVYGQSYHLLHKPSFMRKLSQGQVPPVLMLAVCAMSARYSNHPQLRTEPAFLRGEQWAKPAREIALKRYDTPNITILIVYLILGLHEFGTCQGGRSWMFGGMAQRMAYALQLHQDLDHDPKRSNGEEKSELTFTDREIRRRTMWSCFLLDRFSSSGTDRPTFVGPEHIKAQLPIKDELFRMEITGPTEDLAGNVPNPVDPETGQVAEAKTNMGVAAYTIRMVALWGELINYMNFGGKQKDHKPMWDSESKYQGLQKAAADLKEDLPSSLHYTPENLASHASEHLANQFVFMHIVYHQIVLFMNRFALPTPGSRPVYPKDMPTQFFTESREAAQTAANNISTLVHEGMDHTVVAPFAGYAAFFSSTVHIHGAFSRDPALEASSKQNLAWNVKYLTKMKKHWGMFHFVTENLRDLYRKHADAARPGANIAKTGKDGESIFQYGDWFDRYPHGVSGTDYEEPQADVKKEPGADAVLGQQSDLQTVEEFFSKLSPPSRAVQTQQQRSRKVPKRQHSKAEIKGPACALPDARAQQQPDNGLQNHHVQQQNRQHAMQQMPNNMLDHQQGFNQNLPFGQHSSAFPPGFQPPPNPLLMHQQPGIMSQLDRQMVLSSYAGIDPTATSISQHNLAASSNPMLDPSAPTGSFDLDFSAMANGANTTVGGNGLGNGNSWGDPSSAWFMPFNMDPPTGMPEDNAMFGSNGFDWGNAFADFGTLPPTGLTPGPPMDLDGAGGQDGHVKDGGMESMDGMSQGGM